MNHELAATRAKLCAALNTYTGRGMTPAIRREMDAVVRDLLGYGFAGPDYLAITRDVAMSTQTNKKYLE